MTKPKAVCILCIHPETGHVLAATRPGTTDQWGLIGGKVDPGEDFIQAAYREFQEETGQTLTCTLEYLMTMFDEVDYEVAVYRVPAPSARYVAAQLKGVGFYSVEPNITVGYVPFVQVCAFGPFREFNSKLLDLLLAEKAGA